MVRGSLLGTTVLCFRLTEECRFGTSLGGELIDGEGTFGVLGQEVEYANVDSSLGSCEREMPMVETLCGVLLRLETPGQAQCGVVDFFPLFFIGDWRTAQFVQATRKHRSHVDKLVVTQKIERKWRAREWKISYRF